MQHRNIIKFLDSMELKETFYIAMEHASNGTLFDYIHHREGVPENLALRFVF